MRIMRENLLYLIASILCREEVKPGKSKQSKMKGGERDGEGKDRRGERDGKEDGRS
jgi:hypothetical protein